MASSRPTSFTTQPQTTELNRSVQERADSDLACQMQLDEVLAKSLAMVLPSGFLKHGSTNSINQQANDSEVGETSRIPQTSTSASYKNEPQDVEWMEDDPLLLYNYTFGQQGHADEQNQDQDDVFEALKEQYRLFDLRATSLKDRRFARQLSSLREDEWGERESNPGNCVKFLCEDVKNSNLTSAGSYLPPRKGVTEKTLPRDSEADQKTCNICLTNEMTLCNSLVVSEKCLHRFCTDCLRQYGETMVKSGKSHIPCPEYECEEILSTQMCEFLLSSDTLLIINRRQVEDAVADWERVYCPYKDCSWLQLRPPSPRPDQPLPVGGVQCLSCHRYFCLECQVPWHDNLNCEEYKSLPEDERSIQDIVLLKGLAVEKKWQRCSCGHVVEKIDGCNHITCRCGKEFCYICGQEWTNQLSHLHSCRRP